MVRIHFKDGTVRDFEAGDQWGIGYPPGFAWVLDGPEERVHYFALEKVLTMSVPYREAQPEPEQEEDEVPAD